MSPLSERSERSPPTESFSALAAQVAARLERAAALHALARSARWIFPLALLGLGLVWLAGAQSAPALFSPMVAAITLVTLWLLGAVAFARWHRLPHVAALAWWDQQRATHELFLSASSLEQDPHASLGAALHVQRAKAALPDALALVPAQIPTPLRGRVLLGPLLLLVLSALGLPSQLAQGAAPAGVGDRALDVARSMEEEAEALKRAAEPLTESERESLEQIKEALSAAAERMKEKGADQTPRQVLEELERQAHLAEQLAREMGAAQERISSALLAELERHPDTAEMAGALRAGKLDAAAKELEALAERLKNPNLSLEAQQRIQNAFSSALAVATADDLRTLLGRHLSAAQGHLEQNANSQAGAELAALAEAWRQMARRMRSMEMLKRMAEHLRDAGQQALGRPQQGLKQLSELASANSLSRVGTQQPSLTQTAPLRNYQQMQHNVPPPNSRPSSASPRGSPVPGTAPQGPPHSCPNCGQPRAGSPGAGQPGSGSPIPGTGTQPGGT